MREPIEWGRGVPAHKDRLKFPAQSLAEGSHYIFALFR